MQYLERLRRASAGTLNGGVPTSEDLDFQLQDILPRVREVQAQARGGPGGPRGPFLPPPPSLRNLARPVVAKRRRPSPSNEASEDSERDSNDDGPGPKKRARLLTSSRSALEEDEIEAMTGPSLPAMEETFMVPHPPETEEEEESTFMLF
jgi:hypothetical protein